MWSSERAAARVGLWSIALPARSQHRTDEPRLQVDLANDVIFRIRHIQKAVRPRQSFRTTQLRQSRQATVSRIPLLAGSSHMVKRSSVAIDTKDCVALPEREIHVSRRIKHQCPGPVERRSLQRRTIRGRPLVASAGEGVNEPRRERHAANAVVADVADEQETARRVHGNSSLLARSRRLSAFDGLQSRTDELANRTSKALSAPRRFIDLSPLAHVRMLPYDTGAARPWPWRDHGEPMPQGDVQVTCTRLNY